MFNFLCKIFNCHNWFANYLRVTIENKSTEANTITVEIYDVSWFRRTLVYSKSYYIQGNSSKTIDFSLNIRNYDTNIDIRSYAVSYTPKISSINVTWTPLYISNDN